MTQEDKAKAYDIALDKIKRLLGTGSNCSREDLEYVFPELAESEDERIRKRLTEYFEGYYDGFATDRNPVNVYWEGLEVKEVLAWLEKQGKQKPYGQREECSDCQFNYAGECKGSCAMKRGGQKPAWSEEDEKQARQIERIVHNDGCSKKLQEQIANWFKSIQDRVQPKQEWSEEDEDKMQIIINIIKDSDPDWEELINWLKSLRPQNQWKPSDEQMTALRRMKAAIAGEGEIYKPLNSLYEDLKKLREE